MADQHEDPGGHYQTAGYAIAGLGGIGVVVAAITTFLIPQDLGFIDHRSMVSICALFALIGGVMVWAGRPRDD